MSRTLLPYHADDLSALARALKREFESRQKPPGHVEWLNILVRATGYRNFQHYKAQAGSVPLRPAVPAVMPEAEPIDLKRVEAAARCFNDKGVLTRWPAKTTHQRLCLWRLWSAFPAERDLTEPEVNDFLKARNGFGDHALIRREMVNARLIDRDRDCRRYRRIEQRPPAEALAVIRATAENTAGKAAKSNASAGVVAF